MTASLYIYKTDFPASKEKKTQRADNALFTISVNNKWLPRAAFNVNNMA